MTREEFEQYAKENGLVVWSKEMSEKAIKALEQELKTGHWKAFIHNAYHGTDEDGEPIWREVIVYHCSQCNRRTVIKEKYCPNCGAKMVEPQESEVEDGNNRA